MAPARAAAAALFEAVVRIRNHMYDSALLRQNRLPRPVISIGNLTFGGSGKTPLAIHLAQTVCRLGATPVLLSRGYGRTDQNDLILEPGREPAASAERLGDEPALLRRRVPELWLGISADRYAVGLEISALCARPIFILDDGYQHRRLARNLNLLIIDSAQPLAGNRLMPRGSLREPLEYMKRADVILINGGFGHPSSNAGESCVRSHMRPDAAVFHCVQEIAGLVPFQEWQLAGYSYQALIHAQPVYLVAAIGNPDRFHRDVKALNLEITGARFFRDHARLTHTDWLACAAEASRTGAGSIVTTEKDAVKISRAPDFPLLVAVQGTRIAEQLEMEKRLSPLIGSCCEAD